MFQSSNKIIIVDDQERGLLDLAKKFSEKNLTYKIINYDPNDDIDREALTGVRIAFFDINLVSGQFIDLNQSSFDYTSDSSLRSAYNALASALQSIISNENGPYVLVFWSLNVKLIDDFIKYVDDRQLSISKPVKVLGLDKSDVSNIDEKIDEILNSPSVKLLYGFEYMCEIAATKAIQEIYELIPRSTDKSWGQIDSMFEENFKNVFLKLAISSVGENNIEGNLDKAITTSLMPLFTSHMLNQRNNSWRSLLSTEGAVPQLDENVRCSLNTVLHIDREPMHNERGAVYEVEIDPTHYFDDYDLWIKNVVGLKKTPKNKDIPSIQNIVDQSKLIAVEISASCDYAQNNSRTLKYLLGVKTPIVDKSIVDALRKHNSFDPKMIFQIDDKFQVFFDLNYVYTKSMKSSENLGPLLFTFKKEFVDMIGNRYANHISRIGISSF